MAKKIPYLIDEFFLLGIILVFLMINYNLPLSSIYNSIMVYIILMYLVPLFFGMFDWDPISKKGSNRFKSTLIGLGAGIGFIYFYNYLSGVGPMSAVFATTAFGESVFIAKIVFGILIPIIETLFFFWIGLKWVTWLLKLGKEVKPFSQQGIILMLALSAVFTFFHSTAKGVTNTTELMATFIFAMISVFLVLYFKEAWQAIVMHIVVNSKSVDLVTEITSNEVVKYGLIGLIVIWYFTTNKRIKLFK